MADLKVSDWSGPTLAALHFCTDINLCRRMLQGFSKVFQ